MDDNRKEAIYLELLTKISSEVRQTQNMVNNLDKKLDLSIQKTEYELKGINRLDEQQNQLLADHIAGVNTLRALLNSTQQVNEKRLEKLEAPTKWLTWTGKALIAAGAICTALVGIAKFFKLF